MCKLPVTLLFSQVKQEDKIKLLTQKITTLLAFA